MSWYGKLLLEVTSTFKKKLDINSEGKLYATKYRYQGILLCTTVLNAQ